MLKDRITSVFKAIGVAALTVTLVACTGAESVKREPLAPPVDKKFELAGHLEQEKTLNSTTSEQQEAPIPDMVDMQPVILPPDHKTDQKNYSVSAINVPASDLLFNLAKDANKQLDLASDVEGQVTLNAINEPLDTLLRRIVEQVNAFYEIDGNIIVIRKDRPYWHTYKVDYVNVAKETKDSTVMKMAVGSIADSGGNSSGGSTGAERASEFKKDIVSKHDFWGTLLTNIKSIAVSDNVADIQAGPGGNAMENVVLNREAGLISVKTTAKQHKMITSFLEEVRERTHKQVLIEATVVEVELSDEYQAGVDWTLASSSKKGSTTIAQSLLGTDLSSDPNFTVNLSRFGNWDFSLGIKLLQQFGDAKVLSSPKIMAMNNQSALLKVVDNEVYFTVDVNRESATTTSAGVTTFETQVYTVPVGFMMNMTPFINSEDEISINIRPSLTRIVGYAKDPNPELAKEGVVSQIPIVQEREMDSVLRLRNRQTAIIGGLIQDSHRDERRGIPGLMDIPGVGDLFSYREDSVKKTELIIFIRPIIIDNPDIENGDLTEVRKFLKTKAN